MARPLKEGMDYFPHDTDASNDEKIEALRALYGNDGYAFYFILLERIYRTANAELDTSKQAVFASLVKKVGVTFEKFNEMLQTAFEVGCFDQKEYESRKVLTSNGIKKRAAEVRRMRERWRKKKETQEDESGVFSGENPGENSEENAEETPESKEKKSKENKNNICTPPPPSSTPDGAEEGAGQTEKTENKPDKPGEKEPTLDEIFSRYPRYSSEQWTTIRDYWDLIRFTRKTGRVANSVVAREMDYWERFPPEVVIEALNIHIRKCQTKQEDYTRGIMRRLIKERELGMGVSLHGRDRPEKHDADARNRYSEYDRVWKNPGLCAP